MGRVPGVQVEEPVGQRREGGEQGQGYEGGPGGTEAWPGEQEDGGGGAQHGGPQEQVGQGVEGQVEYDVLEGGVGVGHQQGEDAPHQGPAPAPT